MTLYEVLGIGSPHKLYLPETEETVVALPREITFKYETVEANYLAEESYKGTLTRLSHKGGEVRLETTVPLLSDLKMQFVVDGQDLAGSLYAKVVGTVVGDATTFLVRFTSCSPEIETFLRDLLSATAQSVPASID